MATEMDHTYCQWSLPELSTDRSDSQATSISQLLDHGSISFGRFSVESLSWEKWSVFSHNRCQEELEKFKAPGLVAQKKAYFEEYYRRIRNLKALKVEQEAGLESDPCCNGHYCTQTGEHDQTTTQPGHTVDVSSTEGKANSGDAPQTQLSEIGSSEFYQHSFRGSSKDERKEVTEQQRSDYDNLDDKETLKNELEVALSIAELNVSAIETATESDVSTSKHSEVALKNNLVSNQVKRNVKKQDNQTPVPKAKEAAASARIKAKLDSRTKSDAVKPSEGLRNPIRKATSGKAENGNKVARNTKSTSVSSHRPLTEVRPNVTISRSSILSTDRKLASTRVRDDAAKMHLHSKASTIKSPSSLPIHARGQSCNQSISKEMPSGVKNITSKNKRISEDMSKPSKLISQCTKPKGEAEEHRPKAMSTKQPVRSKSNKNNVIEYDHKSDVGGKQKEGKVVGIGGYGRGSKFASSTLLPSLHQAQAPKLRNKVASSSSANLILNGRKPRQGMSSWR